MNLKETLTLDNIKHDLSLVVKEQSFATADRYSSYIVPIIVFAMIVMFVFQLIWVGIALLALGAFLIVRYILANKPHRDHKKALKACLERGDVAISVERLSHVAVETVKEPSNRISRKRGSPLYKVILNFYFESGASWRVPEVWKHYKWSKEYYLSTKGLDNISVPGNEFYLISLQGYHGISYIYPCKCFTLGNEFVDKKLGNVFSK